MYTTQKATSLGQTEEVMQQKIAECNRALAHMAERANEADWRAELFEPIVKLSCPDRRFYRCIVIIVANLTKYV